MENHATTTALARAFSGTLGPEAESIVLHLPRCQQCWERAARVVAELRSERRLKPASASAGAVVSLFEKVEALALRRLRARGSWVRLSQLAPAEQLEQLREDPALQTLELFSTLAGAATRTGLEDPHLGEEIALVARALAEMLPGELYPSPLRNDLQAEALGIVANCRRLGGDWRRSAAAFDAARRLSLQGTGEPTREARLLSLEASLATDTGRLEKALELLDRAAQRYREAQDNTAVASVAVQAANTLLAACRHEEAIDCAEKALKLLTPAQARLELLARSIVTASLVFVGRPAEALRSFLVSQPLFKELWSRQTDLEMGFLEALLLASLRYDREAEKAFRSNIAALMEAEHYKNAFLTMLTHFECLFRRGALNQAARACEEAIASIEQAGAGCHSQMIELWQDLLTLVNARRLTDQQLLMARQYLVRHWSAPARHAPLAQPGTGSVFSYRPPPPFEAPSPQPKLRPEPPAPAPSARLGYEQVLGHFDRELVAAALACSGGRVRETARLLDLSRNTLRGKLKKYHLVPVEPTSPPQDPARRRQEEEDDEGVRRLRARAWWVELKALPRGQQRERLESVSALQTREMLTIMIDEAAVVMLTDPRRAEQTARLAWSLARLLPTSCCSERESSDLQCEALTIAANCRRLAGDWQGAAESLAAARSHLERGSGEPARRARLLSIEASVASDTARPEEALKLLARTAALFRQAQDTAALAAVAVREAGVLLAACRWEESLQRAEEALRALPPGETRLALLARSMVTESLVYLGRPSEALHSFVAILPLYREMRSPRTELQQAYLEALLLDALGYEDEAQRVFEDNAAALLEAGLYKSALLTLLTQAETHLRRDKPEKAAGVCREALERFAEAGIAGHGPLLEVWRRLLALAEDGELKPLHLRQALQSLARSPVAVAGEAPEPEILQAEARGPAAELELPAAPDAAASLAERGYKEALEQYDRQLVAAALAQGNGSLGEASWLLGIPRNRLRAKLRRYALALPVSL